MESFRRRGDSVLLALTVAGHGAKNLSQSYHLGFAYSKHTWAHIITGIMERAACRIIDANFNRAREAIRVVEEFCRFVLNSKAEQCWYLEMVSRCCLAGRKVSRSQ